MAIPFCDVTAQSRSQGHSALAKAAYDSCSSLRAADGTEIDYTKKKGLIHAEMIFADGEEKVSRGTFWRAVEAQEKRKDAIVSREVICALPKELTQNQQIALAQEISIQLQKKYDLPVIDLCIHAPEKRRRGAKKEEENCHAHIHLPDRDRSGKKNRCFAGKKATAEQDRQIRKLFEWETNRHLRMAGSKVRISVETYERQIEIIEKKIKALEKAEAKTRAELKILQQEAKNGTQKSQKSERDHRRDTQTTATDPTDTRRAEIAQSTTLCVKRSGAEPSDIRKIPEKDREIRAGRLRVLRLDRGSDQVYSGSGRAGGQPSHRYNRAGDPGLEGQSLPTGETRRTSEAGNKTENKQSLFAERIDRIKILLERHQTAIDLLQLKKNLEQANARPRTKPKSDTNQDAQGYPQAFSPRA